MEPLILGAIAVGGIGGMVAAGFIYGKIQQYRGDDVSTSSVGEAMAAAQGKRMDLQERRGGDGDSE